jgi:two-component system chemotaxis response regulator CheY
VPELSIDQLAIALVEPSTAQRRHLCRRLAEAGAAGVQAFASGSEALAALERSPVDLVVSALHLPDGTATELLCTLRAHPTLADVAFMLISSETRFEQLDPIRQAGCIAILPKPFDGADLRRALRNSVAWHDDSELTLEHYDVAALRVLVVDDSRLARRHIVQVLEGMGLRDVCTAEHGREALTLLGEAAFDFVLTDFNMPVMDGCEFVTHLRGDPRLMHLPVVMVTSEENGARLANVAQAGVSALCDKPFDPRTIRRLIRRLLDEGAEVDVTVKDRALHDGARAAGTGV